MALHSQPVLSDSAHDLRNAFDDVSEHLCFEYDSEQYSGISTIGFAHVAGIDGRKSFYTRLKELVAYDDEPRVTEDRRGDVQVKIGNSAEGTARSASRSEVAVTETQEVSEIGKPHFRISEAYDGGRRMSLTNVRDFQPGPEHQRLDVRERLHTLALNRFRYNGYLQDARVSSRVD